MSVREHYVYSLSPVSHNTKPGLVSAEAFSESGLIILKTEYASKEYAICRHMLVKSFLF